MTLPWVRSKLDAYFMVTERGSTIAAEVRGGLVTFLTMSYILLANPRVLSAAGIPPTDVVIGTATGAGVACLLCGLLAKLPFGLAPGMGLSAYFAYGLVLGGERLSLTAALTSCFVAGLAMALMALTRASELMLRIIPTSIKLATVVGMGLLLSFLGMQNVRLVVKASDTLVDIGDLLCASANATSVHGEHPCWEIWMALAGVLLIATLVFHQVKGGILLGIVLLTILDWTVRGAWPHEFVQLPVMRMKETAIDFGQLSPAAVPAILSFLFIGIFDVSGVMFGMSRLAGLQQDGRIAGGVWVFVGSAVGTMVASALGCTPIIVHVESAAGIKEGARTGLAAVVTGLLFFLSLFFAPVFDKVPDVAISAVLIIIGAMMIGEAKAIDWYKFEEALPAFLTIVMMPFTFSITYGLVFGVSFAFLLFITTGRFLAYLPPKLLFLSSCRRLADAERKALLTSDTEDGAETAGAPGVVSPAHTTDYMSMSPTDEQPPTHSRRLSTASAMDSVASDEGAARAPRLLLPKDELTGGQIRRVTRSSTSSALHQRRASLPAFLPDAV